MFSADFVIAIAVTYVGLLFVIAYLGDRRARTDRGAFLRSPLVYTLSISVYCTSWTFYGAVGNAARNGLEFLTIYLGPTIVFIGWWFVLRKLVRIGRTQRITSIADLLSSRFGKSNPLAVLITVIAVIGVTPYIALQLKAITQAIQAITASSETASGSLSGVDGGGLAFGIAALMAVFTILFGTRNVDAKEQHHGVVAAIAFEAVVKLAALLAVGFFVVFGVGGGIETIYAKAVAAGIEIYPEDSFGSRWIAMTVLSGAAVICLSRQFQITVVENSDENHLRTAGWAFPAYMLLMSLFTMPIALFGATAMPAGSNPDMFVLTLPMSAGQFGLALFAFIGGFSSATSMIIVASIALSIMVSNHIVMPIALRTASGLGDGQSVSRLLLTSRRLSIALLLFLGFLYFTLTGDSDALASIGLISFAGVAQFLPAVIAALYWREASVKGAIGGVAVGFIVWAWSMFLPSFDSSSSAVAALMASGPWGISWLRPEALFGLNGLDPLVHSVFWSLFLNALTLIVVSLLTTQTALERIQATLFVDVFRHVGGSHANFIRGSAAANDLFFIAQRVLGAERAVALFDTAAREAGVERSGLDPSPEFIGRLERELAGSIGASSAHVMLSKVVAGNEVSLEEVMQMADETQQVIAYSQELEQKSSELRSTASALQRANERLRELDQQKDDFLSQVSHEVRTPMTSIRSFSEILLAPAEISTTQRDRFVTTIHQESLRLTKLLDEILDLSALERGERSWENRPIDAEAALNRALEVCEALARQRKITIELGPRARAGLVSAEHDRLCQVLINLISNAIKYNNAARPVVRVTSRLGKRMHIIEIADNGPGIAFEDRRRIFEKFSRGPHGENEEGSGLGLAISRQIVTRMNGKLELLEGRAEGACFRLTLPRASGTTATAKRR